MSLPSRNLAAARDSVHTCSMSSPNKTNGAEELGVNQLGLANKGFAPGVVTQYLEPACEEGGRGEQRRADVLVMMERCRRKGIDCALAEWSKGEFGYAELTYGHPEAVSRSVKNGWRIGEDDNMSLAYTYLALDLLGALGDHQT